MGHYDDCYEEDYAAQRREEREAAQRDIPLIIEDLQSAALTLRRGVGHIRHANRIEGDLQFIIAALWGQLGGPQ